MRDITEEHQQKLADKVIEIIAEYEGSRDLIEVGAYRKGSNPSLDFAIEHIDGIESVLRQDRFEPSTHGEALTRFEAALKSA